MRWEITRPMVSLDQSTDAVSVNCRYPYPWSRCYCLKIFSDFNILISDHHMAPKVCVTCVKRTDYLDYFHTNEAVIHSKPSSKSLLLLSRIQILMNQVHAEQSEEESSIIEDETSLEDDINFEDLEDPTTTGDTDDGSLSSAPEQHLIERNHLLYYSATDISLPDSQS